MKFEALKAKAPIYRIVFTQFIATFIMAALCLFVDTVAAYSVLLGGLTGSVPSLVMAWRMAREVADPGLALRHLVRAQVSKLLLTVVMFVLVFRLIEPLAIEYFFAALAFSLFCNILQPLVEARQMIRQAKIEESMKKLGQ